MDKPSIPNDYNPSFNTPSDMPNFNTPSDMPSFNSSIVSKLLPNLGFM